MKKLFYDHLVIIEEVVALFDERNIPKDEQAELLEIIDRTMHQEILATIFANLPRKHHETFLIHFHTIPEDKKILEFLKERITTDIEKQILKTANAVKAKVLREITTADR